MRSSRRGEKKVDGSPEYVRTIISKEPNMMDIILMSYIWYILWCVNEDENTINSVISIENIYMYVYVGFLHQPTTKAQ